MKNKPSALIPALPYQWAKVDLTFATAVQILPESGRRAAILFSVWFDPNAFDPPGGQKMVTVAPTADFSQGEGFALSKESPTYQLHFRDVGSAINSSWWAIADTDQVNISYLALDYQPEKAVKLNRGEL